ncbi:MAG: hypothetical protein WCB92_08470 [Mycobacterium sp.]
MSGVRRLLEDAFEHTHLGHEVARHFNDSRLIQRLLLVAARRRRYAACPAMWAPTGRPELVQLRTDGDAERARGHLECHLPGAAHRLDGQLALAASGAAYQTLQRLGAVEGHAVAPQQHISASNSGGRRAARRSDIGDEQTPMAVLR